MQRPVSLFLAVRNIVAKRDNLFISFVALISTLGLIVGVATLVTVLSVMNGFERQMQDKLLGMIPHVQIYTKTISQTWDEDAKTLMALDPNIKAVSPVLNTQAMVSPRSRTTTPKKPNILLLNGVMPEYESQVSLLGQASQDGQGMIEGSLESLNDGKTIIIGKALSDEMGLGVGDTVTIVLTKSADTPSGITPVLAEFTISGIFKLSNQTESHIALTSVKNVAETLGVSMGVQGYRLQLHDVFKAKTTANTVQSAFPDYIVRHWVQTHGKIYETIQMERNLSSLLLFLIILVAGFNLVSSLVMVVTDKKTDIAILKTMGATPSLIRRTFIWQGLIITALGTAVGVMAGLLLASNISGLSVWVNTTFELGLFDSYYITHLPSIIRPLDVIVVVVLSLWVGVLSTWYPAKKASQVQPAEALRYDV